MANDHRHRNDVKEICKECSTHIERLYADGEMYNILVFIGMSI